MRRQIVPTVSALVLILVIAVTACAPSPPRSDEEKIITEALRHAVVDDKDIPGYGDLPQRDSLVVLSDFLLERNKPRITARDLPRTDRVTLVLLSLDEILGFLNLHGPKGLLVLSWPEVVGDSATVHVSLKLEQWVGPKTASPRAAWTPKSLGYYKLEFRRAKRAWQFVRVVPK